MMHLLSVYLAYCSSLSLSLTIIQVHATQLYHASFMGNIDEVKELLEGGANVNEPNDVCKIVINKFSWLVIIEYSPSLIPYF